MRLFSTEQVSKYHPDKLADQISDTILTEILKQDKHAQCGIETLIKDSVVVLAGEVTTIADVNYYNIISNFMHKMRQPFRSFINLIGVQSPEINKAVVGESGTLGAGDQGMMYGYACDETSTMLPYGFDLANKIIKHIESFADSGLFFKGDAKCQVTVDLDKKGRDSLHTILVSVCQKDDCSLFTARDVIKGLIRTLGVNVERIKLIINPSGNWFNGGATADCGLTGRKIVCDQYGGYTPVGGGAFSGKNPTKVDRSAAYMARYLAKYVVAHLKRRGIASCEIQLAYGIGVAETISLNVKTNLPKLDNYIKTHLLDTFDLTPSGIISFLDLYNVDYGAVSAGCHFRENTQNRSWETI